MIQLSNSLVKFLVACAYIYNKSLDLLNLAGLDIAKLMGCINNDQYYLTAHSDICVGRLKN